MSTVVWKPSHPEKSNMWQFMRLIEQQHACALDNYQALYQWSIDYPNLFWADLCSFFQIQFEVPPDQILVEGEHMLDARWFEGATFNFAAHLLKRNDYHTALISINEQGLRETMTYHELRQRVAECAAGLKSQGVSVGDRVGALLPNVSYTIIAMLATTSLGAIWSSCSPDFGMEAVLDRFGQIEPKVLFMCEKQVYHGKTHTLIDKIKHLSEHLPSVMRIVMCSNQHSTIHLNKVISWNDFIKSNVELTFASLPFNHPLYILFSSGTTGKPKCIMHGAGGTLLQHLKELGLHTDIKPQDNMMFYTTCGWMMWNWMVSTLALGATLTLYEGSPAFPTPSRLFELIEKEKVTVFGTSAKFIGGVEHAGEKPSESIDLTSLRCILSTGSPLLPNQYDYVYQYINPKVQLSSISGGTDIISCFALGNPLLPILRGELQCIGLGMSVEIYNEEGLPVQESRGELVCTKPFPCMPVGFWKDPERKLYYEAYFTRFKGVWAHGDFAELTSNHGLIIYGRSDTVLNPGGVRIGTAEIYRQIEKIPAILDSIVIGQNWQNDVRVVLFVKLKPNLTLTEELEQKIRQSLRTHASPRHVPTKILQVTDIPRTINGKLVEIAVRQIVHQQPIQNLASIANPEALDDFINRPELKE